MKSSDARVGMMIVLLLMRLKNELLAEGRGALDLGFASWLRLSEGFEGDGILGAGGCHYIFCCRLEVACFVRARCYEMLPL